MLTAGRIASPRRSFGRGALELFVCPPDSLALGETGDAAIVAGCHGRHFWRYWYTSLSLSLCEIHCILAGIAGTSPLYVFSSIFNNVDPSTIQDEDIKGSAIAF